MAKRKTSKALATQKRRGKGPPARSAAKKKAAKRAVAVPDGLEGFQQLDKKLWSKVATQISEVVTQKRLQESNEVGGIILKSLFGGRIEQFRAYGTLHQTFQALAQGADFSASYLRYAVLIHDQLKVLRKTLGKADDVGPWLSVSIHRKLLVLKDPTVKAMTAVQIYNEGLDYAAACRAINQARSENEDYEETRGRPTQSIVAKSMPSLIRVMSRMLYGDSVGLDGLALTGTVKFAAPTLASLEGCTDGKVADLKEGVETLGRMVGDLERLRAGLADAIAERDAAQERAHGQA